jgi:hypothetical protein
MGNDDFLGRIKNILSINRVNIPTAIRALVCDDDDKSMIAGAIAGILAGLIPLAALRLWFSSRTDETKKQMIFRALRARI